MSNITRITRSITEKLSDLVARLKPPVLRMPLESNLFFEGGQGSPSFTRASIGTFINKANGFYNTAASGVSRFESSGFLSEGASENIRTRSNEFNNSAWVKIAASVSANDVVSPGGLSDADTMTEDTSTGQHFAQSVLPTLTLNETYTASVFVKSSGRDWFVIRTRNEANTSLFSWFNISTGVTGTVNHTSAAITDAGNGWYRCEVQFDSGASDTTAALFNIMLADADNSSSYTGDGSSGLSFYEASVEKLPFSTSPIPTTSATVTRDADDASIDADNIPAPTSDYTIHTIVDLALLDSSLSQVVYNVDGETSRKIEINTTTGMVEATHGAVTSVSTTAAVPGTPIDIIFVVDGVNQTLYINRVQEDQDVKGTVTGSATRISVGNEAGANQLYGNMKPLEIFDFALDATQRGQL